MYMYTSYFKGNDLIIYNVCYVINYCLFGFFVPLENFSINSNGDVPLSVMGYKF